MAASPSQAGPAEITLAFAGDVHFAGRTAGLLGNPATAFGPISSTLSTADLAMVNLETAVTTRGTPEPKEFHFRAPANAYDAVKAAGVDVVSIANNHTLDYGRVGLSDTLDAAKASGVPAVGAGVNAAAAYAPWITEIRGTTVAFLAFSQVSELWSSWKATDTQAGIAMTRDLGRAVAAVQAARQHADVIVVYVHWGMEGESCPPAEAREFARAMAEAGATIVVGTHAHLLLGEGWMGRTFVQYGLGNFLWWRDDAYSNDTGVLRVILHGSATVKTEFVPALISRRTGQPQLADGEDAARISREYANLRACTGLVATPTAQSR
ncbi:poly-gamma-glutamate synthesis protein (capsule biosynthesis protein) [Micromonospora kangleipakensis]|uniref:Poly-gamma-glutamate synthesis protein (Capsule biosynthesis protein) n=1 Tax=Micromonospora kangleipakensis TaxID=1077942 RepID=A0A4Q8BBX8_9ACTN|nr:CapA family protein [Micromonospora kangleipakensis]RZU75332.1 poly-gamma-glutamate synthesis protein (capsule biosynthesis protein) [Micromonospora kangleipakensis]